MANLLTTASMMMCPHGGSVSVITQNTQATAGGSPLIRASDTFVIAGCSLAGLPTPSPCLQVQWIEFGLKVKAGGDYVLGEDSTGLCVSGTMAPQGTVLINFTQTQVSGQ